MQISRPDHDGNNYEEEKKAHCVCHLPKDVMRIILSYLSVVDYIKFRIVCKCWRLAFNACLASYDIISQEHPARELPWFLVLKNVKPETKYSQFYPILYTAGEWGNLSSPCVPSRTAIPELCGTRILLSKFGWLLLFDERKFDSWEIYFFNPFSKAKIVLPFMDVTKLLWARFDISSPPTSPDCMVLAASCIEPVDVRIDLCRRGSYTWTSYTQLNGAHSPVANSVFVNGIWYLLHSGVRLTKFDVSNGTLHGVRVEDFDDNYQFNGLISYPVKRGEQIFLRIQALDCFEIELINSQFTLVARKVEYYVVDPNSEWDSNSEDSEVLFRTDVEKAIAKEKGVMLVDSFNVDAWCGQFDEDGYLKVRWHRFGSNPAVACFAVACSSSESLCCHPRNDCSTFLMWFEPVWVQPSPNLSWI
ncbi:hypothetical protein COLO4_09712 [Corchorus olitorius]|uniref:F-box domain-containing protein n=1 Tax=Corchorus olitorius TaxID=93759 RepID=A0A1R3KBA4_9ROSI|nr:hypothetical protein COLO4_09712 [Corchorus olitorius]